MNYLVHNVGLQRYFMILVNFIQKKKDIKEYNPINTSIGSGQVLHSPYTYKKARLINKLI